MQEGRGQGMAGCRAGQLAAKGSKHYYQALGKESRPDTPHICGGHCGRVGGAVRHPWRMWGACVVPLRAAPVAGAMW